MHISSRKKILLFIITILVWFSLIAQFVLIIQNRVASIPETILRYFCYFTILSNILVALTVTYQLIPAHHKMAIHFRKQSSMAAVAVYIMVVCIVYNFVLRGLVEMKGLQSLVDELLHVVTPLLYCTFWLLYIPKDKLHWKNAFAWILYPLTYLLVVLGVGEAFASRFYPYPFLDAYNHGYPKVGVATVVILFLYLVLSFTIIALAKYFSRKKIKKAN